MEPTKPKIKEYAGGWITEREGTEIPTFLDRIDGIDGIRRMKGCVKPPSCPA